LDRTIDALADTLAQLEERARREHPVTGMARYPRPSSVQSLRAVLIRPSRTLLAYFWGNDDVYGWRISTDTVVAARLGAPQDLVPLVDFLRHAVFDPNKVVDWTNPARRAYDTLVKPLGVNPDDELLVVPAGPLSGIPFSALVPPDGRALGSRTRIVRGPSASVLATLVATPLRGNWQGSILAVGAPRPSYALGKRFGALPLASSEARTVASLAATPHEALTGRRATVRQWVRVAPRYRYLHLGAHSVVDARRIAGTAILLTDAPLDLATITHTPLTAELVTLSACETALGRQLNGEGIVGLVHAFLAAGARGALVTLWKVPDRVAHDFAIAFYEQLTHGGAPLDALSSVRRSWIRDGRPPADWAGFVLVGSLRP
jgi:CHAT domain-containing protein